MSQISSEQRAKLAHETTQLANELGLTEDEFQACTLVSKEMFKLAWYLFENHPKVKEYILAAFAIGLKMTSGIYDTQK